MNPLKSNLVRQFLATVLLGSIGLLSCSAPSQADSVLVLLDLSASANSQARKDYANYFKRVLDQVHGGDHLLVARIDERPMDQSILDVNVEFEQYSPLKHNERRYNAKIAEQKKVVQIEVDRLLKDVQAPKSPILHTLYLSERFLQGPSPKYIVILSDMIEESSLYNFTRADFSKNSIEGMIRGLKQANRIPNLRGANVYVAGARSKDVERGLRIRDFWTRYFAEAGATGLPAQYGPELLDFRR